MNKVLWIGLFSLALCLPLSANDGGSGRLLLDGFDKESESLWNTSAGANVRSSLTFGERFRRANNEVVVLNFRFERINTSNSKPANNWFKLQRALTPQASWQGASAIQIELSVKTPGKWWLEITLESDGEKFKHVLLPNDFSNAIFQDRVLQFKDFKNANGKKIVPENITSVKITGSAKPNILYIDNLFLLFPEKQSHYVKFTTNEEDHNIFEPGQQVALTFTVGDMGVPGDAVALDYEIIDYFGSNVDSASIALSNQPKYTVTAKTSLPGYYDVKAYWIDDGNRRLSNTSCIKTTGSLEQGRGTYAVMPNTMRKNSERAEVLGEQAFFGFHGSIGKLVGLMGMSWRLGISRWEVDERSGKPKIIDGTAEWARKLLQKPPAGTHWKSILNSRMNRKIPGWAVSKPMGEAPGMKDPDDYFRYLGDRIKVNKHFYPHMKRRIYDIFWEVNLNKPRVGIQKPTYLPDDIVTAYREARKVVDTEDPGAILAGPSPSNYIKELTWLESLFQAGLLNYLDAYNGHGYHTPPPEEGQVVEKTRALKRLLERYNNGKPMDMYCTELGYRSQYGSMDRHKEHAQWHTRVAIILKGEGLKAYYPFYSYDFAGKAESWGVTYNLDSELKFGPKHVSPKAAVPALAVCVNELEGTSPVSDLRYFGNDIWSYIFKENKSGKPIIAIWSVKETHRLKFPAGDVDSLELTNIMGHNSIVDVEEGFAEIQVSPSPFYIKGAAENIYISNKRIEDNILASLYPGEKIALEMPTTITQKIEFWGDVDIRAITPDVLNISVPATSEPAPVPVLLGGEVTWMIVKKPVEVVKISLENGESGMVIKLDLKNRGAIDLPTSVTLETLGTSPHEIKTTLEQGSTAKLSLPLEFNGAIDAGKPLEVFLNIKAGNLDEIKINKTFSFLTSHLRGESAEGKMENSIKWNGKGSSGREDHANVTFEWDKKNLYLKIEVEDDVFQQTRNDGTIWQMDSLQIAFDTHPELETVYAPMAGVMTKKITDMAIARTSGGNLVWRHNTHNVEELELGDVSASLTAIDIDRDENKKVTTYNLAIPWIEIGLDKVEKGKPVGISILVNDSDGVGTQRASLELFGGIRNGRNYRHFGMITLR